MLQENHDEIANLPVDLFVLHLTSFAWACVLIFLLQSQVCRSQPALPKRARTSFQAVIIFLVRIDTAL
jgi:hypothetical protein